MTEPTPIRRRVDGRSKALKARIVGEAEVNGVRPTARKRGIPVSTVESWRQSEQFAQLRTRKREDVQEEVWAAFQMGVHRIMELMPQTEDMNKVAVATGIIYDKLALMTGQATSRTETRELAETLDDHERELLSRILREGVTEAVEA